MEHVVFFPSAGGPAFRRVPTVEEAVRLVEHLRNVEGLTEVSVHPLGAEVPLAFRTWYRVEVPATEVATEPGSHPVSDQPAAVEESLPSEPPAEPAGNPVAESVAESAAESAAEPAADGAGEPRPVLVDAGAANGHSADGGKSLGFFAT